MQFLKYFNAKTNYLLFLVFLLAVLLRFLYFPGDLYFGYDQARDAYEVQEILKGDFKIIGPSTSVVGLYHGVGYYYLIAPFYLLGHGNPEIASAALRILNSLGVLVFFYIGKLLINKKVGLISALLYAISFEETQFAIYLSNPAPAAVSIPLMFLGLGVFIFEKKKFGVPLAFFCLGLSIQFEFALFYLVIPIILILVVYCRDFLKLPLKIWFYSIGALFLSTLSFILAEFKYSFRTINTLLSFSGSETKMTFLEKIQGYFYTLGKMGEFNLYDNSYFKEIFWIAILMGPLMAMLEG